MCSPGWHGCSLVACCWAKQIPESKATIHHFFISHPEDSKVVEKPASSPRRNLMRLAPRFLGCCSMVRKVSTVLLLRKSTDVTIEGMETSGKRTIQVNVKMSAEDFTNLQKAANALWPDAILSNSGIILGLARLAAKDILRKKPAKPRR